MSMLARRNDPFNEMLRPFEEVFDRDMWRPFDLGLSLLNDDRVKGMERELAAWMPATDVSETEDRIKISASLPGLKKDDVKIEFDEQSRRLKLHGEYKQEQKEDSEKFHRVERRYGKFDRSFTLPQNCDPNNIKAKMENGVLNVEVPKIRQQEEKKTGRMINIQ